ncbi:hypothetical protein ACN4EG_21210 [Alkalinema pantanalense CENA528]|uniref:hypothetical protein n=1 Tax=Alkalinema pantanalense TaxID=1620705 RepID=UPI003D6E0735
MQPSETQAELRVRVPEQVRAALEAYAADRNFSMDFVIELALSQFLDLDAVTFEDCNPVMTPGQLREQIEILQYQLAKQQSAA